MADEFKCRECDAVLRCGCQSMECSFDYDISAHMNRHECSCEPNDDGVRIRCPKCTWFNK
jgi:hypothetical protein